MQAASALKPLESDSFFSAAKRNLIGKDWVPASSGREAQVHDPSTGSVLMRTPLSGAEDIDKAVQSARRAFDRGPWTKMTPYERARILLRIADLIEAHREELAQIEAIDAGKPINQARYVDVPLTALTAPQRAALTLHYYEGLPIVEIADLMGCSTNTVKSHLRRGRDRLRDLLGGAKGEAS